MRAVRYVTVWALYLRFTAHNSKSLLSRQQILEKRNDLHFYLHGACLEKLAINSEKFWQQEQLHILAGRTVKYGPLNHSASPISWKIRNIRNGLKRDRAAIRGICNSYIIELKFNGNKKTTRVSKSLKKKKMPATPTATIIRLEKTGSSYFFKMLVLKHLHLAKHGTCAVMFRVMYCNAQNISPFLDLFARQKP